jgi:hypothetical protein
VDRQSAGQGLIYEGGRDRTAPHQDGLEPTQIGALSQQPRELGGDERDVRGSEAGDVCAEGSP